MAPSHHSLAHPRFAVGGDGRQMWRVVGNVILQLRGWARGLAPHRKNQLVTKCYIGPR